MVHNFNQAQEIEQFRYLPFSVYLVVWFTFIRDLTYINPLYVKFIIQGMYFNFFLGFLFLLILLLQSFSMVYCKYVIQLLMSDSHRIIIFFLNLGSYFWEITVCCFLSQATWEWVRLRC